MEKFNIYRTKPEDWKKIREGVFNVENASFEEDIRFSDIDFLDFEKNDTINYIVKSNGRIVGYLMSCPIEHDSRYRKDRDFGKKTTIHMASMALMSECRGKGIGGKLFARFLKDSRLEGFKRVVMDATSDSMIAIGEKHGFKKVKFYKNWQAGRSSWYMEKEL